MQVVQYLHGLPIFWLRDPVKKDEIKFLLQYKYKL